MKTIKTFLFPLLLVLVFGVLENLKAQTITPATGGTGISADNFASGTWTTLSGPVIQETAPGQLQTGNIRFQVPAGFVWDTGGTAPTVTVTQPKGNRITVTLSSRTSSEIIFQLTGNSGGSPPNNPHRLEFSNFRIRPAQGTPLASGQIQNAGSAAPGGTANYGSISMVAGADNKIRVETAPNSGGTVVSAQNVEAGSSITVYSNVRDQFNNFKRNQSSTWSLQNITGGIVSGDLSASGTSATFTGNLVGSANIRATSGGLTVTQSGTISVIPSDATTLAIATQPSSTATAGQAFSTQPVIEIRDDYTNVVSSDNFTQVSVIRGSGAGDLQGTTTVTASSGVATFSGLNHQVANSIDLDFSASGFTTVTSNSIAVNPAAADSLIFTVQPSNANRNTNMSPPVEVQIVDEFNNNVSQSGTGVTLSINSGTGNISGNTANTDASGTATFSSLSFNQTGNKTIIATAAGLDNSEASNTFTIANAGSLAGFEVEITGTGAIGTQTAGTPFDIRIEAVDGVGALLDGNMGRDNFTGNVDLTTTSTFSGTTTTVSVGPFVNGVYDPHNVELITAGDNITITATNSAGSESGSSNTFTVNPAAANADSSLIPISQDTLIADGSSQSDILVQLRDEFGNNLISGGDNVVISRTGTGTLSSTTDNSDGTYSATITAPNNVGSATISATVNSTSITSGDLDITYTFDELSTFLVEASGGGSVGTQTAGTSFDLRITAQDAFNNTVTTFTGTVQITSTGTLSSGGGTTASFTSGVLNTHSVTLTSVGSTTISARQTASTETGTSNSFTVNPGPADETTSTITSAQSFLQNDGADQTQITVQLKDEFGNNLTTGGNTVNLSVTGSSTLSAVTDNSNGTYTSTLTAGTTSETATITGTVDAQSITDDATITITQFNVWDGSGGGNPAGRSDWGNADNWSLGSIPTTGQVVLIESGWTYYPIISGQDPTVDFINIESGGTLTLSGRTLTINNEISGNGSFSGNNGTINLGGDSKISNFISGSSVVNLNGSSTQTIEGDFTADTLNIQNDVTGTDYLEAFNLINIETGNTLTMSSGSELVALGDITVNGQVVGNSSAFRFGGDINGSNFTLTNTSVTLNGTQPQQINGIEEIKSFTLDNPSGAQVNNDLVVTDTLFLTDGTLTIGSGYSFVSNIKQGNTQNIRMLRQINGSRGWRMVSNPLSTTFGQFTDDILTQGFPGATYATGSQPGDTLQPNVLYYDETHQGTDNQRWRAPNDTSSAFTAGRGYYIYFFDDVATDPLYNDPLPDTLSVKGEENSGPSGEFSFPVTYTAAGDSGWNLIGNPYTATIDWDDGNWTKTNMDNVIYVWDPVTGDYLDWNGIAGSLGDGKIKPFQGFWVKANGNGAPTLAVNEDSKTTGGSFYKRQKEDVAIELKMEAEGISKTTHITFSVGGKTAKDELDAIRLVPFLQDTYLKLFTLLDDGTELSINNLPRNFGIPIEIPIQLGGFIDGEPIEGMVNLSWTGIKNLPEAWNITLSSKNSKQKSQSDNRIDLRKISSIKSKLDAKDSFPDHSKRSNFKLTNMASMKNLEMAQYILTIEPGADADGLPNSYNLQRNYPNPFNPSTTLEFSTPLEGPVSLEIYDILGRKVTTLINENYPAGYHQVSWDASRFSSGVYIALFKAADKIFTQKLTLIK
ncbi:MAG: T9SS type A sorting domain-containing protein [Gracilimonas sp.]|uniref:invasin domain 3-containing protein n=1 Tax=Gracilimonas sp. TaxID=1974203 RepID=UPI001B0099F9|nr:invasin domain 3-containing protein [Gracilimonas sp.]MBO6586103.1 T9SS type A sorting domain-containing protein [Gracilimonas sp.]MBO6614760.1 T9SS type A sorting domain-containing protein [Gracilimonas sp.]